MSIKSDIEKALKKPRNAEGKFIKNDSNPKDAISTSIKSETLLDNQISDRDIEKPLVSFSINNPLKKVLYWLKDVRKKQTTTFDFKIKIPLIALPIFLIVLGAAFQFFFNLGRQEEQKLVLLTPTPTVTTLENNVLTKTSRAGTVKATYQVRDIAGKINEVSSESASPISSKIPSRFVLIEKNSRILFLLTSSDFSFSEYINLDVLITGYLNEKENTLSVESSKDIEVFE